MSLTPEQCEEFWALADKNEDGELTIQELTAAVKKYSPNISDKDCAYMFCCIDKNGDNVITKQEFYDEMRDKPKRSETLCQLFREYDKNGDGTLSLEELRQLITDFFKEKNSEDILKEFLKYTDTDDDGAVSWTEFKAFFG